MKEQHKAHQVLPTPELLSLLMMVSVPALQVLKRLNLLNLLSQKIQAYHMLTISHNRHRRSWRVSVLRKLESQTKGQSRTRNGKTPQPSAVMKVRSTFQEQEKKLEGKGID